MQHSSDSERARVLVVDDNDAVRRMLSVALDSAGFNVAEASTQLELQRLLAHMRPQALVLALQRSEADGLRLLVRMRARQSLCDVPIVFLAGSQDDDFRWRATRAGADWFGLRPVGMLELQARLRELFCNGRRVSERSADHNIGQLAWHDDDPLNGSGGYVQLNAG
jgi:two-component system phosphate regulon response regulator PhoB